MAPLATKMWALVQTIYDDHVGPWLRVLRRRAPPIQPSQPIDDQDRKLSTPEANPAIHGHAGTGSLKVIRDFLDELRLGTHDDEDDDDEWVVVDDVHVDNKKETTKKKEDNKEKKDKKKGKRGLARRRPAAAPKKTPSGNRPAWHPVGA